MKRSDTDRSGASERDTRWCYAWRNMLQKPGLYSRHNSCASVGGRDNEHLTVEHFFL
jgi:hypothetical protein